MSYRTENCTLCGNFRRGIWGCDHPGCLRETDDPDKAGWNLYADMKSPPRVYTEDYVAFCPNHDPRKARP